MSSLSDLLLVQCDLDLEQTLWVFLDQIDSTTQVEIDRFMPDAIDTFYGDLRIYLTHFDDDDLVFRDVLGFSPNLYMSFDGGRVGMTDEFREVVFKGIQGLITTTDFNFVWLLYEAFPSLVRREGKVALSRARDPYFFWTEDRLKLLQGIYSWEDFPKM